MAKHGRDLREVRELKVHRGQRYKLTLGEKVVARIKIPKKPSEKYYVRKDPFRTREKDRFR